MWLSLQVCGAKAPERVREESWRGRKIGRERRILKLMISNEQNVCLSTIYKQQHSTSHSLKTTRGLRQVSNARPAPSVTPDFRFWEEDLRKIFQCSKYITPRKETMVVYWYTPVVLALEKRRRRSWVWDQLWVHSKAPPSLKTKPNREKKSSPQIKMRWCKLISACVDKATGLLKCLLYGASFIYNKW